MKQTTHFSIVGFIAVSICSGMFYGCGAKDKIVAKVGSKKITVKEFGQRLDEASYYYSSDFLETKNGKLQVLDGLVKEIVLVEAARRQGIEKNEDFKKAVDQLLMTEMIKKMREETLAVTDKDVSDYYEKNSTQYMNPKELKVAHILVSSKEAAENILNKINAGEEFGSLAASSSLDTASGRNNGELDWFGAGDMVPEFETAAFGLQNNGDVSDIVRTKFGYHLIKLVDSRQAESRELKEVADKIRRIIEKEKFDTWFEKEEKKQRVNINEKALETINTEKKGA